MNDFLLKLESEIPIRIRLNAREKAFFDSKAFEEINLRSQWVGLQLYQILSPSFSDDLRHGEVILTVSFDSHTVFLSLGKPETLYLRDEKRMALTAKILGMNKE